MGYDGECLYLLDLSSVTTYPHLTPNGSPSFPGAGECLPDYQLVCSVL